MGGTGATSVEARPGGERPNVEVTLIRAARALSSKLDLDAACVAVLDAVEDVFGAQASWILLYDEESDVLRTKLFRGPDSAVYAGVTVPAGAGLVGMAFQSRQVVFVPDVRAEDRWFDPARVHRSKLNSVFMLPLVCEDRGLGVVGLDSPRFTADRPPEPSDIELLEALAAQAAVAIVNAKLYQDSEEDRHRLRTLLNERRQLRRQVRHLRDELRTVGAYGKIIGRSQGLLEAVRQAELVAVGDTTVLLLGETGTGKELLARIVHERSTRAGGAFVAVNCAALPSTLVESELFGHEKGAFTGAVTTKIGKFEVANGGTLLFDEIGDLPGEAQAKLLRVLQDSELQRVGSTQSIKVDVRVIAATNQDLAAAIAERRFRQDLYYRLSAFPIFIPPLRDRMEDVPELAQYFATLLSAKLGKGEMRVCPKTIERLMTYSWPGNVRELANVLERSVILASGHEIGPDLIGFPTAIETPVQLPVDTSVSLAEAERRAILAALASAGWRISGPGGAADELRLKPTTLHAKMRKLGIRRPVKSVPVMPGP
ncbi:MAG: sigma 54-interacting transcriptional regulator [Gemmatimonadetes bacterium]|nr:sigma 54-interacting transcriptional regulator [Gemmatimonadota bacterium]